MRRNLLRWTGYALCGVALLLVLAAATLWIMSSRAIALRVEPRPSRLATPTPTQRADAPRHLRVMGCVSCHGEGLRGDLFLDRPGVGKLYAPNLTLIAKRATDAQLDHAIRQGIGIDGRALFIMPSAQYSHLDDAEVAALIAAIRTVPAGGNPTPAMTLGPLGRLGILTGKLSPQPRLVRLHQASSPPAFGPALARGRHLVMTNCGECHGPQLRGREVRPGSIAPDLSIADAYDGEQFRTLLRTGVAPGNKALGLMGDVARSDFKHMTDEEIDAVHAYLVERAQRAP